MRISGCRMLMSYLVCIVEHLPEHPLMYYTTFSTDRVEKSESFQVLPCAV